MNKLIRAFFVIFLVNSASYTKSPFNDEKLFVDLQKSYDSSKKEACSISSILGFVAVTKSNNPELYSMVEYLAGRLEITMPAVYVFKGNMATHFFEHFGKDQRCNAFAIGWRSRGLICIGEDLLKNLTVGQLEAVITHELGHLNHNHAPKKMLFKSIALPNIFVVLQSVLANPKMTVASEVGLSLQSVKFLIDGFHPVLGNVFLLPLAVLIQELLTNGFSRYCENEADADVAKILDEPEQLGEALDHLRLISERKPRFINYVRELFMTHPLTQHRKNNIAKAAQGKKLTA